MVANLEPSVEPRLLRVRARRDALFAVGDERNFWLRSRIAVLFVSVSTMRLPFQRGLVLGTDIARVDRFLDVNKPNWDRFNSLSRRILTETEQTDLTRISSRIPQPYNPSNVNGRSIARGAALFLAGRWAAKEAARKAWNAQIVGFKDIQVVRRTNLGPFVRCGSGIKSDDRVTSQDGELSISHDGDYAVATVLAESLHADIVAVLTQRNTEAVEKLRPTPSVKSENEQDINTPFSAPSEDFDTFVKLGPK